MDDWKFRPARDLDLPPAQRWRNLRRENGLLEGLTQGFWRGLAAAYLAAAHRLRVTGLHHLPARPPLILIANHTSHLDALCLASMLPRGLRDCVFPVAAGDTFFETPTMAAASAFLLNALPMWRHNCGRHALGDLRTRLIEEPCGYILFPEGTRSRSGQLQPFKPGLGMLVAGADVPVVPCRLVGAFEAFPPGRRMPRPRRIEVRIGPAMNFAQVKSGREGWEQITQQCEAAIGGL